MKKTNDFIPLIREPNTEMWICGDDMGGFMMASDAFVKGADRWRRTGLKKAIAPPGCYTLVLPVPVESYNEPLRTDTIKLNKVAIENRYYITAGFSTRLKVWVYHDRLEKIRA